MPLVTTHISYEHEEYGDGEYTSYQKEVEDLDVHSWLWYLIRISELAGYDCSQLQMITSKGNIIKTDW